MGAGGPGAGGLSTGKSHVSLFIYCKSLWSLNLESFASKTCMLLS